MDYYGNNDWRDYLVLQHHGILGMKWGKRNGPPYPLGSSDHSASEKKAGWRKSLGRITGGGETKIANKQVKKDKRSVKEDTGKIKKVSEDKKENISYEEELKNQIKAKNEKRKIAESLVDDFSEYGPREFTKEEKEALDEIGTDLGYKIREGTANKKDKELYKYLGEVEEKRDNYVSSHNNEETKSKRSKIIEKIAFEIGLKKEKREAEKANKEIEKKYKKELEEARKPFPHDSNDLVKDYGKYDPKKEDPVNIERYVNLFSTINKIVDTYDEKANTPRTKAVINEYSPRLKVLYEKRNAYDLNSPYRKLQKEYQDKMASAVLKDLGYSDTPQARNWLLENQFLFWD